MTHYFASAIQAAYVGLITLVASMLAFQGLTVDVASVVVMSTSAAFASTLGISLVYDYLVLREAAAAIAESKIPDADVALAENPWHDPDLVERAAAMIEESKDEEAREAHRDWWRSATLHTRVQTQPIWRDAAFVAKAGWKR